MIQFSHVLKLSVVENIRKPVHIKGKNGLYILSTTSSFDCPKLQKKAAQPNNIKVFFEISQ
ncbi:hypothetical protein DTQ70_05790 [Runella sp. SP2]|nr:hypothetical protein DTQ70_05790 [Runella sp. SP2]